MIKRKDGSHEVKEVELKPVAQGSESKNGKKGSKKSTLPVRIFWNFLNLLLEGAYKTDLILPKHCLTLGV